MQNLLWYGKISIKGKWTRSTLQSTKHLVSPWYEEYYIWHYALLSDVFLLSFIFQKI